MAIFSAPYRVLRVLEYEYPTVRDAQADMERWGVAANTDKVVSMKIAIRSRTFLPDDRPADFLDEIILTACENPEFAAKVRAAVSAKAAVR